MVERNWRHLVTAGALSTGVLVGLAACSSGEQVQHRPNPAAEAGDSGLFTSTTVDVDDKLAPANYIKLVEDAGSQIIDNLVLGNTSNFWGSLANLKYESADVQRKHTRAKRNGLTTTVMYWYEGVNTAQRPDLIVAVDDPTVPGAYPDFDMSIALNTDLTIDTSTTNAYTPDSHTNPEDVLNGIFKNLPAVFNAAHWLKAPGWSAKEAHLPSGRIMSALVYSTLDHSLNTYGQTLQLGIHTPSSERIIASPH